jgi:hypothetical protein
MEEGAEWEQGRPTKMCARPERTLPNFPALFVFFSSSSFFFSFDSSLNRSVTVGSGEEVLVTQVSMWWNYSEMVPSR